MGQEYFRNDFDVADIVIKLAEQWNVIAEPHQKILVSRGHIITSNSGIRYLAEPLIRNFRKFTSNSGWISLDGLWTTELLEAFTHYTYHKTNGRLIVCDLQGRYRHTRHCKKKSRFELSDPAICSRGRNYGVTDLSEKGIESFFANHSCNRFCHMDDYWMRPRYARQWFPSCSATSMLSSSVSYKLQSRNSTHFVLGAMGAIVEADSDDDCDDSF
jgi:hypothetical protein